MSNFEANEYLETARDLTTCAIKVAESDIGSYYRKPFVTLIGVIEDLIIKSQKELKTEQGDADKITSSESLSSCKQT